MRYKLILIKDVLAFVEQTPNSQPQARKNQKNCPNLDIFQILVIFRKFSFRIQKLIESIRFQACFLEVKYYPS